MNIWRVMNYIAWGLSGVFIMLILIDFIKVEYSRIKKGAEDLE
jgi:hypothetical protein